MNNNINLINQTMALNSVSFSRKENLKGTFKVIVNDSINDLIINEEGISFKYSRHVSLEPGALFDISVEFIYSAKYDQESSIVLKEKKYELDREIVFRIVNNTTMPQSASLIISNLTMINGGNPLVTPPNYVK